MENLGGEMPTMDGENVVTSATTVKDESVSEVPNTETQMETAEKMFSRSQVETLMKKRVDRSHQQFFKRYNVKDLDELDALFEKTKSYDQMKDEYGSTQMKIADLLQENAFLRNRINPNRYADIRAFYKGSDIPFTEESLQEQLKTHPEWLNVNNGEKTTITSMGSEARAVPKVDEIDRASKLFGINLR